MPWLSISFENKELRSFLKIFYKVQGIPTLILIDSQNGVKSILFRIFWIIIVGKVSNNVKI
jgi:hypothetical protein